MRRVLALAVCAGCLSCGGSDLGDVLRKYGHSELRPPTTLAGPGTVVHILGTSPFEIGIVCQQHEVLLEQKPLDSTTSNLEFASNVAKTFELSGDYLNGLARADAKYKSVKQVRLSLSDAHVLTVSDTQIDMSKVSEICKERIKARLAQGQRVTVITSVLQADVVYSVQFDSAASAEVKAEVITGLRGAFGASTSESTAENIKGRGLFWGIREDSIFLNPHASYAPSDHQARLVPVSGIVHVRDDLSSAVACRCEVPLARASSSTILPLICDSAKGRAIRVSVSGVVQPVAPATGGDKTSREVSVDLTLAGKVAPSGFKRWAVADAPPPVVLTTTGTYDPTAPPQLALTYCGWGDSRTCDLSGLQAVVTCLPP